LSYGHAMAVETTIKTHERASLPGPRPTVIPLAALRTAAAVCHTKSGSKPEQLGTAARSSGQDKHCELVLPRWLAGGEGAQYSKLMQQKLEWSATGTVGHGPMAHGTAADQPQVGPACMWYMWPY
jgi:hypothetical protein